MIKSLFRLIKRLLLALLLLVVIGVVWLWPRYPYLPREVSPYLVDRFEQNPIIAEVASERGYININGPSIIRVPDWIENPLGRYYLYFSHHKGSYIRLAYADHPEGPWQVHEPGSLQLVDSGFPVQPPPGMNPEQLLKLLWQNFSVYVMRDYLAMVYRSYVVDPGTRKLRGMAGAGNAQAHIASPDVIVDEANQQLVMYYHGHDANGGQSSRIAVSSDGIHFDPLDQEVFSTYLRGFTHRNTHYVLGMPGVLYRSASLTGPFVPRDRILFEPNMRHAGLRLQGDTLYVFWSRVGDTPERLLVSRVDLSAPDWDDWQATIGAEVLRPLVPWEGSELPMLSSIRGELDLPAHELRDPYVFEDEDGQLYLYYVGAGEQAIGVARLTPITP
jgi:hypothetical protein